MSFLADARLAGWAWVCAGNAEDVWAYAADGAKVWGVALFELPSFLNHSFFDANVNITCFADVVIAVAARDIPAGAELERSYCTYSFDRAFEAVLNHFALPLPDCGDAEAEVASACAAGNFEVAAARARRWFSYC